MTHCQLSIADYQLPIAEVIEKLNWQLAIDNWQ
jgi:hypothetical protein